MKKTKGTMIAVEDDKILQSVKSMGQLEGIFAEPSGAAGFAGLQELLGNGTVQPDETVVIIVTGSGLKDVESALKVAGQAITIDPDINEALKILTATD